MTRALPDRLRLPLAFDPAPFAAESAGLARTDRIDPWLEALFAAALAETDKT